MSETYAFQAEINQLLSLIINTFYSNKEVFLRELISNASDANDKIRYESLTNPTLLGDGEQLEIRIIPNKETKTLEIHDNGIGMTKQDMIKNLGTIAHSGTRAFMEALQAGHEADVGLIGQFGVGFYSAFLVAKNVKVISKHDTEDAYVWESTASGSFSLSKYESEDSPVTRGTRVILKLKDDQLEYLEEQKIRAVVKKHSEFVSFPILLQIETQEEVEEEEEEAEEHGEKSDAEEEDGKVEDTAESRKTEKKVEMQTVTKFVQLNTQQPVWMRKPEDVQHDEYAAFYKSISGDWDDHLTVNHFTVDGQVQFKSVLFLPKRPPFDMFSNIEKKRNNIKLYVRKVLITDDGESLLPDYLSFVNGVVDSDDLPLNVSREMLQQNNTLKVIKNTLVKKVIEMISELASSLDEKDKQKFEAFYDAFGKNIKLGVHDDGKNRAKLVELLRYPSSKSDEPASLKDYVTRMKEGQQKIYYMTGENLKMVKSSPFLEKLKKRGLEVLLMVDPIDEYMVQALREYDGKELVCCSKDGLEIDATTEEKQRIEELKKEWQPVCEKIKQTLGDNVQSVKLSERLADNPCVLVTDRYGWSANMERIMKAQALRNNSATGMMGSRKILEINPDHAICKEIKARIESEKDIKSIVDMLYQTVLIDSGFALDEPSKFAQQIYRLINLGISGADMDDAPENSPENSHDDDQEASEEHVDNSHMEEVD